MPVLNRPSVSGSTPVTHDQFNTLLSGAYSIPIPGTGASIVLGSGVSGIGPDNAEHLWAFPASSNAVRGQWGFVGISMQSSLTGHIAFSLGRYYGNVLAFNTGSASGGWQLAPTGTAHTNVDISFGHAGSARTTAAGTGVATVQWDLGAISTGVAFLLDRLEAAPANGATASALLRGSINGDVFSAIPTAGFVVTTDSNNYLFLAPRTSLRYLQYTVGLFGGAAAATATTKPSVMFFTASGLMAIPADSYYWEVASAFPSGDAIVVLQSAVVGSATAKMTSGWFYWR